MTAEILSKKEEDLLEIPIPELPPIEGWKNKELQLTDEVLVPVGIFTAYHTIFTSSVYAAEHSNSPYIDADNLEESLLTMFVRETVAERLLHAQQLLPNGYHLVVFDAYRSLGVQSSLYEQYYCKLKALHPSWGEEALTEETQKYVSLPSLDASRPSPHNTGGSVDVAIIKVDNSVQIRLDQIDNRLAELSYGNPETPTLEQEAYDPLVQEQYLLTMERFALLKNHAQMLDFGTEFDNGTERAALRYYEEVLKSRPLSMQEQEAAKNRRMLYQIMTEAGMVPYQEEWWHFNAPESQMGATVAQLPFATFGAVALTALNIEFEKMRRLHKKGIEKIADEYNSGLSIRMPFDFVFNSLRELNERAVKNGYNEPPKTNLPDAAKIAPEKAA